MSADEPADKPADDGDDDGATQFTPGPPIDPSVKKPRKRHKLFTDDDPVETVIDPTSAVQIGTLINNNYRVTGLLSAGGMGEVYKGENVYTNDPVAIKVILDKLATDQKAVAMFMREARTLSQLSDDVIVRYYNFVRDPGIDRFCLIMEYIKGDPLSVHMSLYGPVPLAAAETLLRRIAKGLEKAHKYGVIHRDLSPDNVMLPDGIISEARLIDFGIAKSLLTQDGTVAGEFAGKFKFVSPEQLGHFGGTIGASSDIYGLGLLIAAAVLGKPLDMGGSIVEAVKARESIPDLAAVPEELRPLLSHMLEPDPANRPASMAQVSALLDAPEEIPPRYYEGRVPTPRRGSTNAPTVHNVAGLALPPTTMRSGLPLPQRPVPPASVPLADDSDRSSGGALKMIGGVFVVLLVGLGFFANSQGFFDDTPMNAPSPAQVAQTGLTPIQTNSRAGFLATFDMGPCTYATRIPAGPRAGSIEGFARTDGAFLGLPAAYEEQFGARPAVQTRIIEPEQCAALDLARMLQGRTVAPSAVQLEKSRVISGESITGVVTDPAMRHVWFALISPRGLVYTLSDRLAVPMAGQRSFGFQLQLNDGTTSDVPQVLIAVVTDQPLASAAQARDGVNADILLPLILDEIVQSGGQGTVALAHVVLGAAPPDDTTPQPDPTENP